MIKHLIPLALIAVLAGCAGVQQSTERRTITHHGGMVIKKPAPVSMSSRNVESVVAPGSIRGTQLGIVYFDFDEYVVKPQYVPVLESVTRMLKDKPGMKVTLEGHTDAAGATENKPAPPHPPAPRGGPAASVCPSSVTFMPGLSLSMRVTLSSTGTYWGLTTYSSKSKYTMPSWVPRMLP